MPTAVDTEQSTSAPRIGCVILAAGRSRRFGRTRINKLLAMLHGRALIVHVLSSVIASDARPIVVVTGHQHSRVQQVLAPLRSTAWRTRFNRHHRRGMSSSLQAGVSALPKHLDGVLICLGDMPGVNARIIDRLIDAFRPGDDAVIARSRGRQGNPVLLGRGLVARIASLTGDVGAKRLLLNPSLCLRIVDTDDDVLRDIDTRGAWRQALRRAMPGRR